MTFQLKFRSSKQPSNIAKSIKKYIQETGGEAKHSECLELCARMFGYSNWHDLLFHVGSEEVSPPDGFAPADELRHRIGQYLREIQRVGFDLDQAWDLLEGASAGSWLGVGRFINRSDLWVSIADEVHLAFVQGANPPDWARG